MLANMNLSGVVSARLCLALLFRRKRVQTMIRNKLMDHLRQCVRISFVPPSEEQCKQVQAVLDLLKDMQEQGSENSAPGQVTAKEKAMKRLGELLMTMTPDGDLIWHYCPFGCHASENDAIQELYYVTVELFMNHPPPVIATNKWTNMWPPVVLVACFLAIPGVVPGAVAGLCRVHDDSLFDIDEEDLVGIDDSK